MTGLAERIPPGAWSYSVEMTLPAPALDARKELDRALHRANRHIGVITGGHQRGLKLIILAVADDADTARADALRMLLAALDELGLGELAKHVEVAKVHGRPRRPGGVHRVAVAPPLEYRGTRLTDGRVLRAGAAGPLGEWFAYTDDRPDRVMAGRWLLAVLDELFELPAGKKEQWVYEAIEELAGQPTALSIRYACPCCDCLTLTQAPTGTFAICEVCRWEDDNVQFRDPDYPGGANKVSLRQARENYRRHGVSELRLREHARAPLLDERP